MLDLPWNMPYISSNLQEPPHNCQSRLLFGTFILLGVAVCKIIRWSPKMETLHLCCLFRGATTSDSDANMTKPLNPCHGNITIPAPLGKTYWLYWNFFASSLLDSTHDFCFSISSQVQLIAFVVMQACMIEETLAPTKNNMNHVLNMGSSKCGLLQR